MATAYTSLLGLALPVTGELQGTWGTTVNDSITSLLDTAVAGTTTLSSDADVTLSTTTGAANQARQAILLCSGARTALRTITAPAQSKIYTVINATTGGFSVKLVGVGPTTGVTVVAGESALVAWNGSDFIKISNTGGAASFTNVTVSGTTTLSGLTASTALALNGSKEVVSVTNTGTGNNVLSASPTLTGTISAAAATLSSDLTLSAGTANGVLYLNGSKVATSGSALTFDGTNFGVGISTPSALIHARKDQTAATYVMVDNAGAVNANTSAGFACAELGSVSAFFRALRDGSGNVQLYNVANAGLLFGVNNAEQMRLTSTGLGIGTSSPQQKLDVNGAIAVSGTKFFSKISGDSYIWNNTAALNFVDSTGNTVQMVLDSSGNLGIGTSSPAQKLHVRQDQAAYTWGRVDNQSSSASAYSGWMLGAFGNSWGIAIGSSAANSNALSFVIDAGGANTERMRLDSSGNLGLGVTPSAWFSNRKAMQIGGGVSLAGISGASAGLELRNNAYLNASGSEIYLNSDYATLYASFNGQHRWYTAPSGTAGNAISFTQAMTLDASGNLGVGTTSPSLASGMGIVVYNSAVGGASRIALKNGSTGDGSGDGFQLVASGGDAYIEQRENGFLAFTTNNTERARITSGGDLLVGVTGAITIDGTAVNHAFRGATGNNTFVVGIENTGNSTPLGLAIKYTAAAPNGTGSQFLYCSDNLGVIRAEIRSNGGLANYSGNNVNLSDRREKTNFAPAKSYLDTICAIPVQTFNYIDQSPDDPGLTLGVVAQDVQAVAPELVMESNWGTEDNPKMRLSIYQTDLQYALMKCIQEQQALITALTARVAALEAK